MKNRKWLSAALALVLSLGYFVSAPSVGFACHEQCTFVKLISQTETYSSCHTCSYIPLKLNWVTHHSKTYSCEEGGTCTISETYNGPCGYCPI